MAVLVMGLEWLVCFDVAVISSIYMRRYRFAVLLMIFRLGLEYVDGSVSSVITSENLLPTGTDTE